MTCMQIRLLALPLRAPRARPPPGAACRTPTGVNRLRNGQNRHASRLPHSSPGGLMRSPRRILVLAAVSAAALLALTTTARADQAFHTLKAPLSAVGNAPLHSGWVSDSHANGPNIGAHEEYHV